MEGQGFFRWQRERSLSVCLSVCLSLCLSIYLSVCLSLSVSVSLSGCLSISLSVCLSVSLCLSFCLSVFLSVCLSLFLCLFLCLSLSLSLPVSLSLSVCLSLSLAVSLSLFQVRLPRKKLAGQLTDLDFSWYSMCLFSRLSGAKPFLLQEQGYLVHTKMHPHRTLQEAYAYGPMADPTVKPMPVALWHPCDRGGILQFGSRKEDMRLPGKGNPNSHGARPVY